MSEAHFRIFCFYQGGPIDNCTHVPGPVAYSSAESEYNTACTISMDLSHFIILTNELMDKDPYVGSE